MAKNVGLIGSVRGKLGNAVFYTRAGRQCSRVYQPEVRNPQTKRQQTSREKMAAVVDALKPFANVLRAGWGLNYPTYTFQRAVGLAIPVSAGIVEMTENGVVIDKPGLAAVMSAGQLVMPTFDEIDASAEEEIAFKVTTTRNDFIDNGGAEIGCGVVVAIWNNSLGQVVEYSQALTDQAEAQDVVVPVPAIWSGTVVYVYAFLKQIPIAVNGVNSQTLPWMYPSRTSATTFLGQATVA